MDIISIFTGSTTYFIVISMTVLSLVSSRERTSSCIVRTSSCSFLISSWYFPFRSLEEIQAVRGASTMAMMARMIVVTCSIQLLFYAYLLEP